MTIGRLEHAKRNAFPAARSLTLFAICCGELQSIYRKKKVLPGRLVSQMVGKANKEHFGQVVTIEDIRGIVGRAATVVRLPCACRWASTRQ